MSNEEPKPPPLRGHDLAAVVIVGMLCVTALGLYARAQGYDGTVFTACIAAIVGLGAAALGAGAAILTKIITK